ncbi:MAG: MFS transporter [Clostridia bacterium]|nr:MFS transporter [Clostridia bacterium]
MEHLKEKSKITKMIILFMITYMVSYMTRINYGAIVAEMEEATKLSKDLLSMALTGSFITYGAGQIISGIAGDKFSPKNLVSYGLGLSVCMNILIPFCSSPYLMLAVWCVNGFAQAFMWPPIVKLMTALFSQEDYKEASVKISWGSSFGRIVIFLIAPVIIWFASWEYVFFFSALFGIVMIFLWNIFCIDVPKEAVVKKETKKASIKGFFSPLIIGIMTAIILQGMLRDGVGTWMPSYIKDTYKLGAEASILTGVVLPLFSIACFNIASSLYRKKFTNPLTCAGVIFAFGAVSALMLYITTGRNTVLSVIFTALLEGSMHGVNLILICMIPPFFQKTGNVSTVSGLLNCCTYIGSAISTYGIALLTELYDWKLTLLVWLIIAILGTIMCLICVKPWKKAHEN